MPTSNIYTKKSCGLLSIPKLQEYFYLGFTGLEEPEYDEEGL
ncbi:MAG: hypothetical protein ACQESK_10365 [Bacteroidota bacterium]